MKNNHKINFKDFLSNNPNAQSCLTDIKGFLSTYNEDSFSHQHDQNNDKRQALLESLIPLLTTGLKEKLSLTEKFTFIADRQTYIDNAEKYADQDLVFCLNLNLNRYYRGDRLFDIDFSFVEMKKFYTKFSHLCSSNGTVQFKESDSLVSVESIEVSSPNFNCNRMDEIDDTIKIRLCSLVITSHLINILTKDDFVINSVCQAAKKQLELTRERELINSKISEHRKEAKEAINMIFDAYFKPAFCYDEAQHQIELFKARKIHELRVTECFIDFSVGTNQIFTSLNVRDLYLTINKAGPASIKCYMTERDMENEYNPQVFNVRNMADFDKRSQHFFMQESIDGENLMSIDVLKTMKNTLEVDFK